MKAMAIVIAYVGTISVPREEQEEQAYAAIATSEVGRLKEVKAEFPSKEKNRKSNRLAPMHLVCSRT